LRIRKAFYVRFNIGVKLDNTMYRDIGGTFMATKQYSCVKRTKKAFETSLVQLSEEQPLNKITVKMYQRYYRVNDIWSDQELSGKDMTFDEYFEWSQKAQDLRRDYIDARDAISKNLNLSSKQKYSKKKKMN
jgi:hypothetical protein